MTPNRFNKLKTILARRQPDLTVLMDNIHKSHNIAAVLRTCDAVGISKIHAVSPDGQIRRHHMVSGGSRRWVNVTLQDNAFDTAINFKKEGWQLVAAHPAPNSIDYRSIDYTKKTAIILGSELEGLTSKLRNAADKIVIIPMEGMVASLNVSVAAALILYEAQRQRKEAKLYQESRLSQEEYDATLFEWAHPEIAERCQNQNIPYPKLNDDGSLAENPFKKN
ncbi:MAG: tRNA (guanosine(18)-2'-O)-methyltransferase TrmH [Rhodospirillaceae bacterium]|nr:tRNA (guanosine(18)-2'-O)-methyltransferase TrmH [Rhodospirillaceae bacterium]|tara:strand:- start:1953 stop:2618 length:666 start_codon:yes stop_codon:yes gene_type:complete